MSGGAWNSFQAIAITYADTMGPTPSESATILIKKFI